MAITRKGERYADENETLGDAPRLRAAIDRLVAIRDRAADLAAALIDELDRIDGGDLDAEADDVDDEDTGDREPSIGWRADDTGAGQAHFQFAGGTEDLEGDLAEAGVADLDALALHEEDRITRQRFDGKGDAEARELLDRHGIHRGRWREPIGPLSAGQQRVVEMGGRQVMVFSG